MNKSIYILSAVFVLIFSVSNSGAYDHKQTHRVITKTAVPNSMLANYLKNNLGILKGYEEIISERKIVDWLSEGSYSEDVPACRASNHFHNPLFPWNISYINDPTHKEVTAACNLIGWLDINIRSNVTWATGYLSPAPGGEKASFLLSPPWATPNNWDKAREYYYEALTSKTDDDYSTNLADTFQAVGQVMHLLQDMSVPAHTRNDFAAHLIWMDGWMRNPFEYYVANNSPLINKATPVFPTFINTRLTDFWDTDVYNGDNPSTSTSIGLAEFSNANYFSDSTIPNNKPSLVHTLPHPQVDAAVAQICEDFVPGKAEKRKYISRRDHAGCDHFATASILNDESEIYNNNIPSLKLWLDANVHNTYAKELLPRAIGYSARLLDYFFRGTLEISPPDQFVYSVTDGYGLPYTYVQVDANGNIVNTTQEQQFTYIKAKVRNTTPKEKDAWGNIISYEQMGGGILQAVAKYKNRTDYDPYLLSDEHLTDASREQNFSYSVSEPVSISSLSSTDLMTFTFDFTNNPIPAGITDLTLQVVFKGTLGNEPDDAIAVGFKDLSEPTHHVFRNDSDMFSLQYNLYLASRLKTDPVFAGLRPLVDMDGDGIFNETAEGEPYIDPVPMTLNIAYKDVSSQVVASAVATVTLPAGRFARLIVLVDAKLIPAVETQWVIGDVTNPIYDIKTSGEFEGAVSQDVAGGWKTSKLKAFRKVRQHYYTDMLMCKPTAIDPATGAAFCPYNEFQSIPADLTPFDQTELHFAN